MKRFITILLFSSLCSLQITVAQSYYFGIKGGLTIGTQQWQSFEQDALFRYHGIAFLESASEESIAIFGQAGYHLKGSAIRGGLFVSSLTGNFVRPPAREFIFQNASLTLGVKQKFSIGGDNKTYYMIGVRGDYTIDTNLDEYEEFNELNTAFAIYPFNSYEFINRINYGFTFGGGLEIGFSEFIIGLLELSINPDVSFQYRQPAIPNVNDPFTGNSRTIPEREIRNLTIEITAGIKFLRKVEYVD